VRPARKDTPNREWGQTPDPDLAQVAEELPHRLELVAPILRACTICVDEYPSGLGYIDEEHRACMTVAGRKLLEGVLAYMEDTADRLEYIRWHGEETEWVRTQSDRMVTIVATIREALRRDREPGRLYFDWHTALHVAADCAERTVEPLDVAEGTIRAI